MKKLLTRLAPCLVGVGALVATILLSNESLATNCNESSSEDCGGSVASVSEETSSTTAQQQAAIIRGQVGNAVRSRLLNLRSRNAFNEHGWVAGTDSDSLFGDIGGWINYAYRNLDLSPTDQDTDTDLHALSAGLDATVGDRVILGVSISGSRGESDVETRLAVNTTNLGDITQTTGTISPYIGVVLTDNLYIDAAVGYSNEKVKNEITLQQTGLIISRFNQDGHTRFGFIDLTYIQDFEKLSLSATTGLIRSITKFGDAQDVAGNTTVAAQESDSTLWLLGAQASVYLEDGLVPYAALAYERSLVDRRIGLGEGQPGLTGTDLQTNDENNFRFTLGIDWTPKQMQSMVISVEGDAVIGRRNYDEFGALLNLRSTF